MGSKPLKYSWNIKEADPELGGLVKGHPGSHIQDCNPCQRWLCACGCRINVHPLKSERAAEQQPCSANRKLWSFPISPHHLAVERSSLCLCWLSNKQLPLSLPCLMGTFVLWTSIDCVKKHWTRIAAMKIIRRKQRLSGMALIHFDLNSAVEHQDWAHCEDLPPCLAVSSTTCSSRIRNNLHSQSNTACDSFSWLSWEATGCSRRGDGCCTLPWDPGEHQAWEATSKKPPLWQSLQQGKAWALQCHWPGVWIKQHKRQ